LRDDSDEHSYIEVREQIQKLRHGMPFLPFAVEVSTDAVYAIPTRDHVLAAPALLFVLADDGTVDAVPYSHIRRISFDETALAA